MTTTARWDYHWKESGEFSHSMQSRTALTFRDGKIIELREFLGSVSEPTRRRMRD